VGGPLYLTWFGMSLMTPKCSYSESICSALLSSSSSKPDTDCADGQSSSSSSLVSDTDCMDGQLSDSYSKYQSLMALQCSVKERVLAIETPSKLYVCSSPSELYCDLYGLLSNRSDAWSDHSFSSLSLYAAVHHSCGLARMAEPALDEDVVVSMVVMLECSRTACILAASLDSSESGHFVSYK
jgi:hypothetical protein